MEKNKNDAQNFQIIGTGKEYAKIGEELVSTLDELIKQVNELLDILHKEIEKYPLKEQSMNAFEQGIFGICDMIVEKQEELVNKQMSDEKENIALMIQRNDIQGVYDDVLKSLRLLPTLRKEIIADIQRNSTMATYPNSLKRRTIQTRIDLLKSSIDCFEMQRNFVIELYDLEAGNAL